MEFKHISVLYTECMQALNIKKDGIYVDGTIGGGGHSFGICSQLSEKGTLIGIDRDMQALDAARARLKEFKNKKVFVNDNYSNIKEISRNLGLSGIDGALLDIGVSSFQLDEVQRGFSYMNDAPLDMRMDTGNSFSAFDVVNSYSESELERIIHEYGEERWAKRIAKFIVNARKNREISRTGELVEIIKAAVPKGARREGPHPAKRTFQAIRIEVNAELEHLKTAVEDFCDLLNPGGRLAIISFHSLEDRIVKEYFQKRLNPCTCPKEFPVCVCGKVSDMVKVTTKPILPTEDEVDKNPRARSAKLRIIEKKE
ncbi:MAG: 16S rRNA (cytosine(1402)-N(4))-methyltransferase RsmH [Eubacteriales bacterium]